MVGRWVLVPKIGVRVPVPEQNLSSNPSPALSERRWGEQLSSYKNSEFVSLKIAAELKQWKNCQRTG